MLLLVWNDNFCLMCLCNDNKAWRLSPYLNFDPFLFQVMEVIELKIIHFIYGSHIHVENKYLQEMAWIFVDHFLYFFLLRILFSLAK